MAGALHHRGNHIIGPDSQRKLGEHHETKVVLHAFVSPGQVLVPRYVVLQPAHPGPAGGFLFPIFRSSKLARF